MASIWTDEEKKILKRYCHDRNKPSYRVATEISEAIRDELARPRSQTACYAKMKDWLEHGAGLQDPGASVKSESAANTPTRVRAVSRRLKKAIRSKSSRTGQAVKRVLVYGDTHYTFHCQPAIDIMIAVAKDVGPDIIIHNGDVLDCHELSRFDTTEPTEIRLVDEVTEAHKHFVTMRGHFPEAEYIVNMGNHDHRILRYIGKNARALFGLPELRLESLLGFEELGILFNEGVAGYSDYALPHLLVGHFNKVNKWAGYTAKNLLDTMGMSVIQGHVHRLAMGYRTQPTRQLVGVEAGCLCNLQPTYMPRADWQHGFCIITCFPGGEYQVQLVPIITAHKRMFAIWGSEIYEQKLS